MDVDELKRWWAMERAGEKRRNRRNGGGVEGGGRGTFAYNL
jgi:hypothetical protein